MALLSLAVFSIFSIAMSRKSGVLDCSAVAAVEVDGDDDGAAKADNEEAEGYCCTAGA